MEEKKQNASTRAKRKYNEKAYDRLTMNIKKGRKDEIKTIAEQQGQSLNAFVLSAIDEKIERLESEVINMSITVNLTDDELHLIESYAKIHGISIEQALKSSTLETIEDEYDTIIAEEAYREFLKNPVTYSCDEVWGD